MYKRLYFIGIPAYLVMLVFSVLFYKERIILLDTAFTLLHIVKDNSFAIQVYRFGDFFSQLLPVLARKAEMPLDKITLSYSLGFSLYYFGCYLVCGSVFKQYRFALVVLLLNILFVADTFYWTTSQLPESIALFAVLLSFLAYRQFPLKPFSHVFLVACTVTLAFFHPLMVVISAFTFLFFAGNKDIFPEKKVIYYTVAVFVLAVVLKATVFRSDYEQHSMSGLKNFVRLFPDYFTLYSHQRFLQNCISKYYWIPVAFAGIVIFYAGRKEWRKLALFGCFFAGYFMLINVCYPDTKTPVFYVESMYLPLSYFIALPLVFDIAGKYVGSKLILPAFMLLLGTGCVRLYTTHHTYTTRLDWERRFLQEHGHRKMIYPTSKVPMDTLVMEWGTPYEFWLLSTIEQNKTASIIIDPKPELRSWASTLNNSMVVNWDIFPYALLHPKYFRMTDSTTAYEIIK